MDYETRKKFLQDVDTVKATIDFNAITASGYRLWPLVINFAFTQLYVESSPALIRKTKKNIFFRLFAFCRLLKIGLMGNVDKLFFGAGSYRTTLNGQKVNRFFDPILDSLQPQRQKNFLVEYKDGEDAQPLYRSERVIVVSDMTFLMRVLDMIMGKIRVEIYRKEDLVTALEIFSRGNSKKLLVEDFDLYVTSILVWARFYELLLKFLKPKTIFILCYYYRSMYGLCLAARKLKIEAVDLQHGAQGNMHINYFPFSQSPDEGYEFLPKHFWVWDFSSEKALKTWIDKQKFHSVLVGGNPWRQFQHEMTSTGPVLDFLKPDKPLILLSLQCLLPVLDDFVLEAIKATSDKYQWWVRTHPRTTLESKQELQKKLEIYQQIGCVILEDQNHRPLNQILQVASLHVSKYSGTTLEAADEGVITLLIDNTGKELFSDLISNGDAIVSETNEGSFLASRIEDALKLKAGRRDMINSKKIFLEKFN